MRTHIHLCHLLLPTGYPCPVVWSGRQLFNISHQTRPKSMNTAAGKRRTMEEKAIPRTRTLHQFIHPSHLPFLSLTQKKVKKEKKTYNIILRRLHILRQIIPIHQYTYIIGIVPVMIYTNVSRIARVEKKEGPPINNWRISNTSVCGPLNLSTLS